MVVFNRYPANNKHLPTIFETLIAWYNGW